MIFKKIENVRRLVMLKAGVKQILSALEEVEAEAKKLKGISKEGISKEEVPKNIPKEKVPKVTRQVTKVTKVTRRRKKKE